MKFHSDNPEKMVEIINQIEAWGKYEVVGYMVGGAFAAVAIRDAVRAGLESKVKQPHKTGAEP